MKSDLTAEFLFEFLLQLLHVSKPLIECTSSSDNTRMWNENTQRWERIVCFA